LAGAARLSSLADETPEGRSIVALCGKNHGLATQSTEAERTELMLDPASRSSVDFVPFTAQTRMSGINLDGRLVRKGAASAVRAWVEEHGGTVPNEVHAIVDRISQDGATPLVVAERVNGGAAVRGVIRLSDVVKPQMRDRFAELRKMGIRTVMITGDNPLTAKAIAEESGVDDYLAEATPEDKMALIRKEQEGGRLVAMTGDGTNDAPALAQSDVGMAMNSGTMAAKEGREHGRPGLRPDQADRGRGDRQAVADHPRR